MANEEALRDENGSPTLLFADAGETRRVTSNQPLPVADQGSGASIKTKTLETTGQASQTVLTPAAGKKLVIRGAAITHEPGTAGDATLQFQSGKIVLRVYRADHSGHMIPMNLPGNVDEPLIAIVTGSVGSNRDFYVVNYLEE